MGTFNQNLSVPYRVAPIWISGGYREQEFIRFLQGWIHLGTRWAHSIRIYPFLTELDTFGYKVGTFGYQVDTGNKNLSLPRIYPFLTELDTFGYQVGTGNKNLSVPYRVGHIWIQGGHIWIPGGYREQEFIPSLQSWTHLDIRWVQGTNIYPFFTEVNTSEYQVGTWKQPK